MLVRGDDSALLRLECLALRRGFRGSSIHRGKALQQRHRCREIRHMDCILTYNGRILQLESSGHVHHVLRSGKLADDRTNVSCQEHIVFFKAAAVGIDRSLSHSPSNRGHRRSETMALSSRLATAAAACSWCQLSYNTVKHTVPSSWRASAAGELKRQKRPFPSVTGWRSWLTNAYCMQACQQPGKVAFRSNSSSTGQASAPALQARRRQRTLQPASR
jgi:hypothetical protein